MAPLPSGEGAILIINFHVAGLMEIGGRSLIGLWLRDGKSPWLEYLGTIAPIIYGITSTLQPAHFG